MEVLKKGLTIEEREFRKKYWWNNKKIDCKECEAEYRLKPEDGPTVAGHYHCGALIIDVFMNCPNCNTRMSYTDPPTHNEEVRKAAAAYAEEQERKAKRS